MNRGLVASPVLKLLLYDARSCIEIPFLWPTEIWLLLHGRKLKEETTVDLDDASALIGHEGTTSIDQFISDSKHQAGWPERGVEGMDPKRITTEL